MQAGLGLSFLVNIRLVYFQMRRIGPKLSLFWSQLTWEEEEIIEPKSSFPIFTIKNLDVAKSFYTENLGFDVVFSGDRYLHLISSSGVQVGFLLPEQSTQPPIFKNPYIGEGVIFSLEVEDADTAFEAAKSKSLNIVLKLRTEDWGEQHFCIQDPNGIYLDIVQTFKPTKADQSNDISE